MNVVGLYRYPVKSMQGQLLDTATVGGTGIVGDRSHAIRDDATGIVLTGRRDPAMLFAIGVLDESGAAVQLPDGEISSDPAVLSSWIGRRVHLIGPSAERSTYEIAVDPEDDDSQVVAWQGPAGSFHDSTRAQLSIVATGDLREWDVRRFRPNVVVEGASADVLIGRRVRLGGVELDVVKPIDRCVMVTRPQPNGIARDLDVLRTVNRQRGNCLGVAALVATAGDVAVGDHLEILDTA